jgi:hypothetical protein
MTIKHYAKEWCAQPDRRYSARTARKLAYLNGHWGPWHTNEQIKVTKERRTTDQIKATKKRRG